VAPLQVYRVGHVAHVQEMRNISVSVNNSLARLGIGGRII
jgi:hypothetical protein